MRVMGDYELVRELGFGGMGSVHLAFKRGGLSKPVAVKVIHPQLARERAFVDMFFDEVRVAARMQHRHVVRVLDVADGEAPFVVMEHVAGQHLGRVAKRAGALDARSIARIIADAATGLHHAHRARDDEGPLRLVHRDVSPQNILIGYDGVVKVTDFGIAKAERRLSESTATGRLKGKCAYLAPEQVTGGHADFRADVFALGVVAWELVAGRPLFRAESDAETLMNVVNAEIAPLDVPGLWDVIARALARDPSERWPSAEAMAEALEAHAATEEELAAAMSEWFADERSELDGIVARREKAPSPTRASARSDPKPASIASIASIEPGGARSSRVAWIVAAVAVVAALLAATWFLGGASDASTSHALAPLTPIEVEEHPDDAGPPDTAPVTMVELARMTKHPVRVRHAPMNEPREVAPEAPPAEALDIAEARTPRRTCGNGTPVYRVGTEAEIILGMSIAAWDEAEWARTRREWTAGTRRCYAGHDVHDGLTWRMRVDEAGEIDLIRPSTLCPNPAPVVECMRALLTKRPIQRLAGDLHFDLAVRPID